MKVSEMTKDQLLSYMNNSGEIYRYKSDGPGWQRAFILARQAGMENMDHGCAKCIQKVKEWLEKV